MTIAKVLLDTDTLSAIMRKNTLVLLKARAYLTEHGQFTLSIITRFEILRGLKVKGATKQEMTFDRFCTRNIILPIMDATVVKAAEIYADLHRRGVLISDADILIAASAFVYSLGVVTNNEEHFRRIEGLHVDNWLK
ncbi:MAG: VapC toxin family PIN domain ribonuclease [Syntrophaceae bacterium CG2_30_49_12]|nr:MAG: VapC toxin family PIN domain ribonuclease [Syntrophaceae bacterium CG2_30_49_12]PJC76254.1 MAG: VapC toxin family PIN domain ribonuclease [Syntrophobacterales bacterium CG_4_8_14_3_um_filter_49_14]